MRKLLVIDTETGGLNPDSHSLLSLAALVYHDGVVEDEYYTLINEGQIVLAEEAALGVNGLTIEQVRAEGVAPLQAVNSIVAMLMKHDMRGRVVIAAHNAQFDVPFFRRLWRLAGADFDAQFSYRSLCTQTGALLLDQAGRIELPGGNASLDNLCALWGIPRKGAHNALVDARATALVLRREIQLMGGKTR